MSRSIVDELMFLLDSFFLGAVITCVYDGFLVLRRVIRHSMLLVSLEDLVFWMACAVSVFYVLCEENNGVLRWFAVAGACLGMTVYKKTLSPPIVRLASRALGGILRVSGAAVRMLLKPLVLFSRLLKKKLTACGKKLKIILCRH